MDTSPIGLKKNWVTDAGGLPLYIRAVAHAFIRKGVPESAAIQRAVGVVQDWARGSDSKGGRVTAGTQAKAAAAIVQWEAMKARAHAYANDGPAIDLAGMFTESLHPRAAGGKFGSKGGQPVAQARARHAPKTAPVPKPATASGAMSRAQQLRYQASQDRQLAHQILLKVAALVRARDAAIAGIPAPKAAGAPVNAAKLNGQIRLLTRDARLLAKAANHLDAQANAL